jgi:hypothetical protein
MCAICIRRRNWIPAFAGMTIGRRKILKKIHKKWLTGTIILIYL